MRTGKVKMSMLLLIAVMSCFLLTACNREEDAGNITGGSTSQTSTDGNGLNPPENVGSPNDVDFSLQGPGTTNFDDVGLNSSQPGVAAVGDPQGEGEFNYTINIGAPEDSSNPPPNLNSDQGQGEEQDIGQTLPSLTLENEEVPGTSDGGSTTFDSPVTVSENEPEESDTPAAPAPTEEQNVQTVPDSVKLPNTGIFLEDD